MTIKINQIPGFYTRAEIKFKPSTLNEKDASVEFTLATETPAKVIDWERWEVIDEVLLASGCQIPESGRIPLQDSHDRSTINANLGHVANIRREGDEIVGRLFFDKNDPTAMKAFNKVKDGHLDSGSIGYNVTEKRRLMQDETYETEGKKFTGPMQVSNKWELKEYSIVAIGADKYSKVRNEINFTKENKNMPEKTTTPATPENIPPSADDIQKKAEETQRKAMEALKIAERKLIDASIIELCAKYNLRELANSLIEKKASFEDAQREVIDFLSKKSEKEAVSSATIKMGETEGEKTRDHITEGLMMRGFGEDNGKRNEFANQSILQVGIGCLERMGVNVRGLSSSEIARKLIQYSRNAVATDNTTASFSSITENVVNKATMRGFKVQPHSWQKLCSVGSVSDFNSASRVGFSDNADLPLKLEGAEYRESKFSDRKETGAIGTYADKTTLTEEAIISDNLSVLMTIPLQKGAAAMRVPETLCFAKINTPPTLNATSLAWFSSSNATNNDLSDADGLNATNLSTAFSQLKQVKGPMHSSETNTDYLEIMPKVVLVHPDLEMTAKILKNSVGLPQTGMSGSVYNPLSEGEWEVVSSSRLSVKTTFHVFGDAKLYPIMEMLFLNGRVAPEVFLDPSTNIDGITYRIRIRCGIIVLDWRAALRFRKA